MVTVYTQPTPPHEVARAAASPERLNPRPISVNGVMIDRAMIARETQNHPAAKPAEAWNAAARALVVRELLLQEARRRGLTPAPLEDAEGRRETDEEALMRGLVETDVVTPSATEAECRRYFEQNRNRFRTPPLLEVRHILLAASPRDEAARAKARREAEALVAALTIAPERFAELAADLSACPSGRTGGSLGQISRGQTVPEFESAVMRLPATGLAPQPIETRYGLHVVALDRKVDGAALPFEAMRQTIADWLDERVHRTALRQYVAGLAEQATITGISLDEEPSPPQQ